MHTLISFNNTISCYNYQYVITYITLQQNTLWGCVNVFINLVNDKIIISNKDFKAQRENVIHV